MSKTANIRPKTVRLDKKNNQLCLEFAHPVKQTFKLGAEYLRVHTPSAEARGHGTRPKVLQTGKKNVSILKVELSGNYALKISFDDGHDSGLYTWLYLYDLCANHERYWNDYLLELKKTSSSRDPDKSIVRIINCKP